MPFDHFYVIFHFILFFILYYYTTFICSSSISFDEYVSVKYNFVVILPVLYCVNVVFDHQYYYFIYSC